MTTVALALTALALGGGVVASLVSRETVGTKLAVLCLAASLALPLLSPHAAKAHLSA